MGSIIVKRRLNHDFSEQQAYESLTLRNPLHVRRSARCILLHASLHTQSASRMLPPWPMDTVFSYQFNLMAHEADVSQLIKDNLQHTVEFYFLDRQSSTKKLRENTLNGIEKELECKLSRLDRQSFEHLWDKFQASVVDLTKSIWRDLDRSRVQIGRSLITLRAI